LREVVNQVILLLPVAVFGVYPQPLCLCMFPTLYFWFLNLGIVNLSNTGNQLGYPISRLSRIMLIKLHQQSENTSLQLQTLLNVT
jgi:hypothetical protein